MALWQAIICGIFYYLNAGPWVCGIGFYTFGRPMVLGFFVGLILGDPITGTIVGATIQMIYLGLMSTGGSYPADSSLAGIIGTAAAVTTGLSAQEAIAIAVPIGLIGTIFYQLRMVSAVPCTHLADKYAEGGYLTLWIPQSDNAGRLAELRQLIADEKKLCRVFNKIYEEENNTVL